MPGSIDSHTGGGSQGKSKGFPIFPWILIASPWATGKLLLSDAKQAAIRTQSPRPRSWRCKFFRHTLKGLRYVRTWSRRWLFRLINPSSNIDCKPLCVRRRVSSSRKWRRNLEQLEDRLAPATTLSIANASAIEPVPGGSENMIFTATRTGDLTAPLTVGYTTVAGTAQPTTDYTPETGTTTFAAGSTTATIAIPIFGNGVYNNPNLTFSVELMQFAPAYNVPTGSQPVGVTVADLNGDGKPDFVVANRADNTVSALLNTTPPGATTPTFANQQTFATGRSPDSVAVADLNGDGKPDLIIANYFDNTVSVFLNSTPPGATTPTLANQQTYAAGAEPISVTVADVNGDGKPDLIVANRIGGTVSVLLNTTSAGRDHPHIRRPENLRSRPVTHVRGGGRRQW